MSGGTIFNRDTSIPIKLLLSQGRYVTALDWEVLGLTKRNVVPGASEWQGRTFVRSTESKNSSTLWWCSIRKGLESLLSGQWQSNGQHRQAGQQGTIVEACPRLQLLSCILDFRISLVCKLNNIRLRGQPYLTPAHWGLVRCLQPDFVRLWKLLCMHSWMKETRGGGMPICYNVACVVEWHALQKAFQISNPLHTQFLLVTTHLTNKSLHDIPVFVASFWGPRWFLSVWKYASLFFQWYPSAACKCRTSKLKVWSYLCQQVANLYGACANFNLQIIRQIQYGMLECFCTKGMFL